MGKPWDRTVLQKNSSIIMSLFCCFLGLEVCAGCGANFLIRLVKPALLIGVSSFSEAGITHIVDAWV